MGRDRDETGMRGWSGAERGGNGWGFLCWCRVGMGRLGIRRCTHSCVPTHGLPHPLLHPCHPLSFRAPLNRPSRHLIPVEDPI